jgi:hypothetical protein
VQHKDVIRVLKLNGIVGRPAVMLAADQQAIPSWADRESEICQTGACTGDPQDRAARNTEISDPRDTHGSGLHRDSDVNEGSSELGPRKPGRMRGDQTPMQTYCNTKWEGTGPDTHEIFCQPRSEVAKTQIISKELNNWGRRNTSVALAALVVCWGNCHLPSRGTANSLPAHKPPLGLGPTSQIRAGLASQASGECCRWKQRLHCGSNAHCAVGVIDMSMRKRQKFNCGYQTKRQPWSPHREPGITN